MFSKKNDILIIGTMPPPIGGVTIHISRLLKSLQINGKINFYYFDLKKGAGFKLLYSILKTRIVHIHTSNSIFRFLILILCKVFLIKSIFTFHGNLFSHKFFRNLIDFFSILIADYPIVINKLSYQSAKKINNKTHLISAFIPPFEIEDLNENVLKEIELLKKSFPIIFCTNASEISYDSNGEEIYQISTLIKVFSNVDNLLIISDPSGEYKKKMAKSIKNTPENIYWINFPHDFNAVLKIADCLVRYTTTDGDSLSVKEALVLNKNVIASDVVDRPIGVTLTPLCIEELTTCIKNIEISKVNHTIENGFDGILKLYNSIINERKH